MGKKSSEKRRKILKSIAASGGIIVAGKSLPESWSRPVVDSVMLPAHAETTSLTGTHFGQTQQEDGNTTITYDHCITPNADRTAADIDIVVTWFRSNQLDSCTYNARFHLAAVPIDSTLHQMNTVWFGCSAPPNGFVKLTSLTGNAVGRFECGCGGLASDFDLGIAACSLTSTPVCDGNACI